jgi:predicted HicB family RNase H-like nuclease
MKAGYEAGAFRNALNQIKAEVFGTTEIVLHRRNIIDATPPFQALKDEATRKRFDEAFLQLVKSADYKVSTVLIDKQAHKERYAVWQFHPYHYCLTVLLERYVQRLQRIGATGDVMVEARGQRENRQLQKAYAHIYKNGTDYAKAGLFQESFTSHELKIKPKQANIAGLQLADLLANPSYRHMVCEKTKEPMKADFSGKLVEVLLESKYHRSWTGNISGYGKKWLP